MRPAPNDDQVEEGKAWRRLYEADLQDVMLRRQHHMHMPDAQGHRKPLGACKRKDNKDECRHGFPKFHEITEQALVVCPEMAARMRMPVAGRRSAVGSLHGALNHEYLNGCIPAISVGGRDNNDIKLPYRFPITAGSHSSLCSANCVDSTRLSDMVQAIEASQDATIGYCFDYATKRQPVGVYECREWMKGHNNLAQSLQKEEVRYAALRHTQRVISDCFAKGIVRGAPEVVNLSDHAANAKVTSAELIASSDYATFAGGAFLHAVEHGHTVAGAKIAKGLVHVSNQAIDEPVQIKKLGVCYGIRGDDPELKYLSPYEFVRYWQVVRCASHPGDSDSQVKVFPQNEVAGDIAHCWVMKRRHMPIVPVFQGCPMPKNRQRLQNRNGMLMMAYFHPWTLCEEFSCEEVPHVSTLGVPSGCEIADFSTACAEWLNGRILSQEMQHVVQGFMSVSRVRPRDPDAEGDHSENQVSDEECFVSPEDLTEALLTKAGGRSGKEGKSGDSHNANAVAGISLVQQLWSRSNGPARRSHKTVALPLSSLSTKEVIDALRKLKTGESAGRSSGSTRVKYAEARMSKLPAKGTTDRWICKRASELSDDQRGLLQRIADRCYQEADDDAAGRCSSSEPLRWLLHGKPGTGKSHVLRCIIAFFEECLHWKKRSIQLCVAALQAVTAAAVGGDTLHHTASINPFFFKTQTIQLLTL